MASETTGGAGTRLPFLPPCSPDSIEQVSVKLKYFLRWDRMRTGDDLSKNAGAILEKFRSEDCANYFVNSGYVSVQPERKPL